MCSERVVPEPWLSFLRDLDDIAKAPVDFHCIGGFVVAERYGFYARHTEDLDVLCIVPKEQNQEFLEAASKGSELHKKHNVYLDYVTIISEYPEDYDQRLSEMYPGLLKKIRLFAVEAHDLALMKLGRNHSRDRDDVLHLVESGFLTSEELKNRYEKEMRPYIALPERSADITLKLWMDIIHQTLERRKRSNSAQS